MALGMAFPVFLHTLVMEKETRLLDTMKINGMRISNYWLISFIFYQCYYLIIAFLLYYLGTYYFHFGLFMNTNGLLQFVIMFGWGLS